MDFKVGAPALLDRMNAHLITLQDALSHAFLSRVRRPIAKILADTAALAGWQALDIGVIDRAWRHHELARQAAQECGDLALLTHAMGQQAIVLLDLDESEFALELIQEARSLAEGRTPPRLLAWLWATEAEVRSCTSSMGDCRPALDRAGALLPSDGGAVDPEMPYIVLDSSHLARWRGNVLARTGDPAAVDELHLALAQRDPAYLRAETGLRCDLAYAYQARGEYEEARMHAAIARRLASRTGSVRQRRRLNRLAMIA